MMEVITKIPLFYLSAQLSKERISTIHNFMIAVICWTILLSFFSDNNNDRLLTRTD